MTVPSVQRLYLIQRQVAVEVALAQQSRLDIVSMLIWTGCRAASAADADVAVDRDDAVGPLVARAGGAHVHAGRIGAVIAEHGQELPSRLRILAHLVFVHPGEHDIGRRAIRGLAG
jgi:hypothetical protein